MNKVLMNKDLQMTPPINTGVGPRVFKAHKGSVANSTIKEASYHG